MYLYFSKARKLQTMIAHGSPIRQGDGFGLYVCFDLDFFDDEQNSLFKTNNTFPQDLYCYYKTSNMDRFASEAIPVLSKGTIMFQKNSTDEVTYRLVDNDRYLMYYVSIVPTSGLTQYSGDLELVFTFERVVVDASELVGKTPEDIEEIYDAAIRDAINMTAKLYVEPTFGKNKPKIDTTMNQTNYEQLLAQISEIRKTKNIALEPIKEIQGYSEIQDANQKLLLRAESIYNQWMDSRKGWIILNKTDETIEVCDMYMMFGEDNMFVVSSETGIIYKYTQVNNEYALVPQMYSVNVFGDTLIQFLSGQNKANLVELLIDYLQRIAYLETNTLQDIQYNGSKIRYKQNNQYTELVNNDTLRTDLGIETIERDAVFNVDYTRAANLGESNETPGSFIVKTGQTSSNQEIVNTSELKQDMKLDLVDNKASSDNINVVNKSNLVATIRALVDTLENGDAVTVPEYTKMKQRVEYIYQFLQIEGDSDNIVNKIEEIITVLNTIPENSDIWGTLTNIFNKIGEGESDTYFYDPNPNLTEEQRQSRTIKGRIDYLYQNADKNIIVFIRYSDPGNRDLLTINTSDWESLDNPNPNYPDAEYYAVIDPKADNEENAAFENVVDMEVIFDNTSEMETLLGAEFDLVDEVLYIYASEVPEDTITIDTIKLISNVHHTMSLNVAESNQLADHEDRLDGHDTAITNINRDINDINNTKLPQYVKAERRTTTHDFNVDNYAYRFGASVLNNTNQKCGAFYVDEDGVELDAYINYDDNDKHTLKLDSNGLTLDGESVLKGAVKEKTIFESGNDTNTNEINTSIAIRLQTEQKTQSGGSTIINGGSILDMNQYYAELTTYYSLYSNGKHTKIRLEPNTFTIQVVKQTDASVVHTLTFDANGELKVDNNPILLQNTNADTNGQVKAFVVDKTGIKATIKGATDYDKQVALINDGSVTSGQVQGETYSRDKIDTLLSEKQNNSNLITSWSGIASDSKYPSEALVLSKINEMAVAQGQIKGIPTSGNYCSIVENDIYLVNGCLKVTIPGSANNPLKIKDCIFIVTEKTSDVSIPSSAQGSSSSSFTFKYKQYNANNDAYDSEISSSGTTTISPGQTVGISASIIGVLTKLN